jgi:DNA modification methylase
MTIEKSKPTSAPFVPQIVFLPLGSLRPNNHNARIHSKRQVRQIASSIRAFGHLVPILVDESGVVLAGHGRLEAAKLIGVESVPTIVAAGLTEVQKRAFMIADNKLAQNGGWDRERLAVEIEELSVLLPPIDLDISVTGFETGEIDILLTDIGEEKPEPEDRLPPTAGRAVARRGELWTLHKHRILCGDARDGSDYHRLMKGELAAMVFADPPYNVRVADIQGRGRVRHNEFPFASGEMSDPAYGSFLSTCFGSAARFSRAGAVHYICMDWRHIDILMGAGRKIYQDMLNIVVWVKSNSGQGSFYRSQHELIAVYRVDDAPHQNNVELGKHGRNRSNVWTYPGVNSFGVGRDDALASHPTPKPVALVADAMRDCTSKCDIVLDPFLGSGTTVMAAEKIGRRCFGIEYEPAFVDVAIRRWQAYSKADAILEGDGRTFDEIAVERLAIGETASAPGGQTSESNEIEAGPDAEDWIALCSPARPNTPEVSK